MGGDVRRRDTTPVASGGDLDRLVRTEQRLQEVLAASEAEAARILAEAQASVAALRQEFELELTAALRALEERVAAEGRAEIDRIEREFSAEKAALEAVSDAHVEELADLVVQRLCAGERRTGDVGGSTGP